VDPGVRGRHRRPGLFIIAFLDSSFLSFPQVIDLLVVTSVLQHPHWMPYYAVMSTLGSILGCLTIYSVARKGGEALLRRRFSGAAVDRAQAVSTRYGVFALLVPSLLPPPAPFKLFVLLAGVSGLRPVRFALTIALGRGLPLLRYRAVNPLVWPADARVPRDQRPHGRLLAGRDRGRRGARRPHLAASSAGDRMF
jgi:membrane protein YqaA with SNARE-associated domain